MQAMDKLERYEPQLQVFEEVGRRVWDFRNDSSLWLPDQCKYWTGKACHANKCLPFSTRQENIATVLMEKWSQSILHKRNCRLLPQVSNTITQIASITKFLLLDSV